MGKGWKKTEFEYITPTALVPIFKRKNPVCFRDRLCWVKQGADGKFYTFSDDMLKPNYNEWNW